MQGMLKSTSHVLRRADRVLYELKAAHHATPAEDLADEGSEVLEGTPRWSGQDCTEFLDWKALDKANPELKLTGGGPWLPRRHAAHLQAKRVDASARRARQVMERVLWDYDCRRRESQRLRPDHHRSLHTEES